MTARNNYQQLARPNENCVSYVEGFDDIKCQCKYVCLQLAERHPCANIKEVNYFQFWKNGILS